LRLLELSAALKRFINDSKKKSLPQIFWQGLSRGVQLKIFVRLSRAHWVKRHACLPQIF